MGVLARKKLGVQRRIIGDWVPVQAGTASPSQQHKEYKNPLLHIM
jgi:hypothetical protein